MIGQPRRNFARMRSTDNSIYYLVHHAVLRCKNQREYFAEL